MKVKKMLGRGLQKGGLKAWTRCGKHLTVEISRQREKVELDHIVAKIQQNNPVFMLT